MSNKEEKTAKNNEDIQSEQINKNENMQSNNTELDTLKTEIESLKEQLNQEKETRLMALADFDNYKKRIQKEREEMNLLGNAALLNILLEVMEDLERGLGELKDAPVGLTMIKDKVANLLKEYDIEEVEIKPDDKFDPSTMEAIGTIKVTEDDKDNKVVHVERKAYRIKSKDMIIRTARVIVGKKKVTEASDEVARSKN